MRKQPTTFLFLLVCILLGFAACKKDRLTDEEREQMNNSGVALDREIMNLGTFFGNVSSDVVLIHSQPGPVLELKTTELKELLTLTERDDDFFVFNAHQIQTLRPDQFDSNITFEQAKILNQQSVDRLVTLIQHFQRQSKKVYVFGIGFGAYVVQELINREGPDIADKYLLMAGRLDMPDLIWESFSIGNTGGFINGATPFTGAPSTLSQDEKNSNKLFAGLAYKRYTVELAKKYDDLSNLTYCSGRKDATYGRLSQNEKAFLITRQANILEADSNQVDMITGLIDKGFEVAFEE